MNATLFILFILFQTHREDNTMNMLLYLNSVLSIAQGWYSGFLYKSLLPGTHVFPKLLQAQDTLHANTSSILPHKDIRLQIRLFNVCTVSTSIIPTSTIQPLDPIPQRLRPDDEQIRNLRQRIQTLNKRSRQTLPRLKQFNILCHIFRHDQPASERNRVSAEMCKQQGANTQSQFQKDVFEYFAAEGCFGSTVDFGEEVEELEAAGCLELVELEKGIVARAEVCFLLLGEDA